jgi:uncharacterized protein (TIGR02598 family)
MPAGRPAGSPAVGSRRTSDGFSLIEVVIAVGIFAFVIIPVIGLVSGGMKNLRQSMDDTVRADIAREIVGEALRSPWTNVVPGYNGQVSYYTDEGAQQGAQNAQTIFKATTTLSNAPALLSTDTNCKLLIVTVQHVSDTNNKTVYTQLLINTKQ